MFWGQVRIHGGVLGSLASPLSASRVKKAPGTLLLAWLIHGSELNVCDIEWPSISRPSPRSKHAQVTKKIVDL